MRVSFLFLGLTALRSDEVIDLMIKEYPAKHAEYSIILQERERQRIAKEYSVSNKPTGRVTVWFHKFLFNIFDISVCSCL